ncbi:MAG: DoxX family protein [Chitinophagaceae bacterium]|nr:DoxX family protein [Chitinophagaceae bacterium]
MTTRTQLIIDWALRLIAAGLMVQSLFFKFSASDESVYIFSTLGIEPWGRILTGSLELVASILILIPATTGYGAGLAAGVLAGAIFSHLFTKLGIVVKDDHGQLFIYALIIFISSLILLYRYQHQIWAVLKRFTSKRK